MRLIPTRLLYSSTEIFLTRCQPSRALRKRCWYAATPPLSRSCVASAPCLFRARYDNVRVRKERSITDAFATVGVRVCQRENMFLLLPPDLLSLRDADAANAYAYFTMRMATRSDDASRFFAIRVTDFDTRRHIILLSSHARKQAAACRTKTISTIFYTPYAYDEFRV